MPVYSVDYIMSLQDKYLDRPYPSFSLDYIVSRKQKGERLVRSESAWVSRSATTQDEAVIKQVQGALNKLTPEKYKEVLAELKDTHLLESQSIQIFIKAVFSKALAEPAYSEMYGRLCFDMAKFELSTIAMSPESGMRSPTSANPESSPARRSQFRDAIVQQAQAQFQVAMPDTSGLSPEDEEEAKSQFVKRKKANIKFVGQLFLQGVLSQRIMISVMQSIAKLPSNSSPASASAAASSSAPIFYPDSIDIEVLCELLETVGRNLDQPNSDGRAFLNALFHRLSLYLEKNPKYPPRIHFKIMDTLDRRANRWEALIDCTASSLKPMTMQAAQQDLKKKQNAMRSPSSTVTPTNRKKHGMQFPETPPSSAGSSNPATPLSSSPSPNHHRESRATASSAVSTSAAAAAPAPSPAVPFTAKVTQLLHEWCEEHNPLRSWQQRFHGYGFGDDEVRDKLVNQVLHEACTTTRREAQRDAADFLVEGLSLTPSELLSGFGKCLARAIQEDLLEDTPRYFERFTTILSAKTDNASELYRLMCSVVYCALPELAASAADDTDSLESYEDQLQTMWSAMPRSTQQLDAVGICSTIINARGTSSLGERTAAMMLRFLCVEAKLIPATPVEEWAASAGGTASPTFLALLKGNEVLL